MADTYYTAVVDFGKTNKKVLIYDRDLQVRATKCVLQSPQASGKMPMRVRSHSRTEVVGSGFRNRLPHWGQWTVIAYQGAAGAVLWAET